MLHKTIVQILPEIAIKYGNKTALIVGDRKFSFDELNQLSDRLAIGLATTGDPAGAIPMHRKAIETDPAVPNVD